jgi:hypothetical protein
MNMIEALPLGQASSFAHKINGRWYCYQRPLRLILEVLDPKVILSAV